MISDDMTKMSGASLGTVSNTKVIAIDQDPAGVQATVVPGSAIGNGEVWIKRLSDGSYAVALLNRGSTPMTISTTAAAMQLPAAASYKVTNLWNSQHSTMTTALSAQVQGYSTVLVRVSTR
jgi:alpha-galactosidase